MLLITPSARIHVMRHGACYIARPFPELPEDRRTLSSVLEHLANEVPYVLLPAGYALYFQESDHRMSVLPGS